MRSSLIPSKCAILLALMALVLNCVALADPKVDEETAAPVMQGAKYVVSEPGGHLAAVGHKGSRMMVVVDGVAGPKVDEVIDSKHIVIAGSRAADGKNGLFLDGNYIFPVVQRLAYVAFSPDSQHLFWMNTEPVENPTTDAFEFVTYADGKPVAHHDRSPAAQALLFPQGFSQQAGRTPPGWHVDSDGTLKVLCPSTEGIKRVKVTPGSDTNLETLVASAKAQPAKGKAH